MEEALIFIYAHINTWKKGMNKTAEVMQKTFSNTFIHFFYILIVISFKNDQLRSYESYC